MLKTIAPAIVASLFGAVFHVIISEGRRVFWTILKFTQRRTPRQTPRKVANDLTFYIVFGMVLPFIN